MSVISACVFSPAPPAVSIRLRASARACSIGRHEGSRSDLDIHDQSVEPGCDLLRQDRGGDQWNRFHCAGDVADGVEAPIGGREISGLADDRRSRPLVPLSRTWRGPVSSDSQECCRSCRACRPYGRGRDRKSSVQKQPQAAAIGTSRKLTLSPMPPVECLSTTGPPRSHFQGRPGSSHRPWSAPQLHRMTWNAGRSPWRARRPARAQCCRQQDRARRTRSVPARALPPSRLARMTSTNNIDSPAEESYDRSEFLPFDKEVYSYT